MSDRISDAMVLVLLLALPISALVARRLPVGTALRYALAWIAIFAAATLAVVLIGRVSGGE